MNNSEDIIYADIQESCKGINKQKLSRKNKNSKWSLIINKKEVQDKKHFYDIFQKTINEILENKK